MTINKRGEDIKLLQKMVKQFYIHDVCLLGLSLLPPMWGGIRGFWRTHGTSHGIFIALDTSWRNRPPTGRYIGLPRGTPECL